MAALCRPSAAGSSRVKGVAPPLLRLIYLNLIQFYHSSHSATPVAAQPQLDPDYYHFEEEDDPLMPSLTRVNSSSMSNQRVGSVGCVAEELDTWRLERGVQWAFIGYNRARFLYAERLSKLLEVPHISITSLVRQDLSPRTSLYKQIANAVNQGTLVPEGIIFELLAKRLRDGHSRGESGFILDGIPRTHVQAEILDQLVDINLVVNFKCTENLGKRILSQYKLLEDYYKQQMKLLNVQTCTTSRETWQGLLAALHLQHVAAIHNKLPSGSDYL